MTNRFMELFRCNARMAHHDTVAPDFDTLRRANYERDDAERAAGIDFASIFRKPFRVIGSRTMPTGAFADREDRG